MINLITMLIILSILFFVSTCIFLGLWIDCSSKQIPTSIFHENKPKTGGFGTAGRPNSTGAQYSIATIHDASEERNLNDYYYVMKWIGRTTADYYIEIVPKTFELGNLPNDGTFDYIAKDDARRLFNQLIRVEIINGVMYYIITGVSGKGINKTFYIKAQSNYTESQIRKIDNLMTTMT
jgi:hypothetical protein